MKRLYLFVLIFFNLTACIQVPSLIQPTQPAPAPSQTPFILLATPTLVPALTATSTALPTVAVTEEPVLAAIAAPALIEIALFDESHGWGRAEQGFYRTLDGGQTWQLLSPPFNAGETSVSASFYSAETIYLLVSNPETFAGRLIQTNNGGQDWQQNDVPFSNAKIIALNPTALFAAVDLGAAAGSQGIAIYQSLDGGQNWQKNFAHVPGETSTASLPFGGQKSMPAFLDAQLGFIGGSRPVENDIFFYRTPDAGRSWTLQPLPLPATISGYMAITETPLIFSGNVEHILIPVHLSLPDSSQAIFFSSSDRGQTWQASNPLGNANAYSFIDLQTGWVWAESALYTTTNGGQTWQTVSSNLPDGFSPTQLKFVSPQTGWALGFDENFQSQLFVSHDGGQTWNVP